jgi:AcrR family transcriptional regulator
MPKEPTKKVPQRPPDLTFSPASASISVKIQLSETLYLRDPQESKLGRNIIRHSISLLDELGLEEFTFKKLAVRMDSTEASIYRYFSNKHVLLAYLSSYYWSWIRYRIEIDNKNVKDLVKQLEQIIDILVDAAKAQPDAEYIDMEALHRIVVSESTKVYHTKLVDDDNRKGFFHTYKALCSNIAAIISKINPQYPYPKALATTLMEMAKNNIYFAFHLPRLTDIVIDKNNFQPAVDLLNHFAFTQLGKQPGTK